MYDNDENEERRREEQQELERQQKELYRELSLEQREAEKAQQGDQQQSVEGRPRDVRDDWQSTKMPVVTCYVTTGIFVRVVEQLQLLTRE